MNDSDVILHGPVFFLLVLFLLFFIFETSIGFPVHLSALIGSSLEFLLLFFKLLGLVLLIDSLLSLLELLLNIT